MRKLVNKANSGFREGGLFAIVESLDFFRPRI